MMIVAGDNILGKYEGMEQYSKPHSITLHPLYNKSTSNADIMLIKVQLFFVKRFKLQLIC